MFEHKICGRCGTDGLLKIAMTPAQHSNIAVGQGLLRTVDVSKYVCTDCGLVEEWVNSKEDLKLLKDELGGENREVDS